MEDSFIFENNFIENEDNNHFHLNLSFQNDESSNYYPNMNLFNQELNNEPQENELIINNSIFPKEAENINKEINPYLSKLFEADNNNLSVSNSQSPLNSTKGSGNKNDESKIIIETKEEKKINNNNNNNNNNNHTGKKRKQRIHLEDLDIDPEIIKYKKYQTIGDKVITSKNKKITDLDRKEIRAIRNRISAQKSRDRKKAEFNELQKKVKFYEDFIKKQNLLIKDFERLSCSECRSKLIEIKLNISLDQNDMDKEYLVLDEDISFFSSDKKNNTSLLTKLTGTLITFVCIIGVIFCFLQGGYNTNLIKYSNNINNLHKLNENLQIRKLSESEVVENNSNDNLKIKNENVLLPINKELMDNSINQLRLYHDRFGFEIYSYLEKKNKEKNGFLMKKQLYNQNNNYNGCIETKNIEHNNYIIDENSLKNTLPIEANNIIIDNNLSHKIISLFVKDYHTLNRYINGKSLTLQEQIEIEAKNSEDGCVYLQMIIPNYKNDDDNTTLNSEYKNSFFEIRCKIFAYNNYYETKLATTSSSY